MHQERWRIGGDALNGSAFDGGTAVADGLVLEKSAEGRFLFSIHSGLCILECSSLGHPCGKQFLQNEFFFLHCGFDSL